MSGTLAKRGLVLAGRLILFLVYNKFGNDAHVTDMQSFSHLENTQGTKDIKGFASFLAVWNNLVLNFECLPKPLYMYTAFLSQIWNIPEL